MSGEASAPKQPRATEIGLLSRIVSLGYFSNTCLVYSGFQPSKFFWTRKLESDKVYLGYESDVSDVFDV